MSKVEYYFILLVLLVFFDWMDIEVGVSKREIVIIFCFCVCVK